MRVQLAIRDIVLIDRLELNFRDGLSVLTGETGTGKSILQTGGLEPREEKTAFLSKVYRSVLGKTASAE